MLQSKGLADQAAHHADQRPRSHLAVVGATSIIQVARKDASSKLWATKLLERKPARVVSVALAKKTARIVWAMLTRGQDYGASALAAIT